ncbi:MAG: hypothetical protein ACE145_10025 [Terriglobia bacterium]
MNPRERERFVDDLLDASLRQYRSAEPRAGLENRILASVRASEFATQPRRWAWALAGGVAILVIAVVSLRFVSRPVPRTATVPSAPLTAAKTETPKGISTVRGAARVTRKPNRPQRVVMEAQRRPEQFPTPAPLTEQETLLLLYLQRTPASELATTTTEEPIEDLKIPELAFAPLEIRPLSEGEHGQVN